MTKEKKESAIIPIQQIFVTWDNGAKGVFSGPAALTPEEMSELNPKPPRIVSVKVTKPMIIQRKDNAEKKKEV